jgi:hypothetical protein
MVAAALLLCILTARAAVSRRAAAHQESLVIDRLRFAAMEEWLAVVSVATLRQLGRQSTLLLSILAIKLSDCVNYLQGALPELNVVIVNEMHVGQIFVAIVRSTEIEGIYIRHGFIP